MDTKKIVEVTCPYCGSILRLQKKIEVTSKTIICPYRNCGKELRIIFDVTKEPQTYKIITEEHNFDALKKDKTIYKKQKDLAEDWNAKAEKKKTIYRKANQETPHSNINRNIAEDKIMPKRHYRLKEDIFLIHTSWFGLKNKKFKLHEGITTVGRFDEDTPSDISIRGDNTMSRRSIAITIEEENGVFDFKLKVLNATNQVKVNDQRVKEGSEVYLDFGDTIILGKSKFKFDNH